MDGHVGTDLLDITEDNLDDLSKYFDEDLFESLDTPEETSDEYNCENQQSTGSNDQYNYENQQSIGIKRKNNLDDDFDTVFPPALKYMKTAIEEPGPIDALSVEAIEKISDTVTYNPIKINGNWTIVLGIPPQQYHPEHKRNDEQEQNAVRQTEIIIQETSNEKPSQSRSKEKKTEPIHSAKKAISAENVQAERRRRNNDASRRSRQSKREKNKEMEAQVKILERQKEELLVQLETLTAEVKKYKDKLMNRLVK